MARVLFDNTFLALLWRPSAPAPTDPATKEPVTRHADRIDYLLEQLEARGAKAIIATPALSELLVGFKEPGQLILDEIDSSAVFEIVPFGRRAAIEAALATQVSMSMDVPKGSSTDGSYQKVKVDRQIVAIATIEQVETIYSDDSDVKTLAETAGIKCLRLADLPLPPEDPQKNLFTDEQPEAGDVPQPEQLS